MTDAFQKRLKALSADDVYPLLMNSKHGLEKECLRINPDGTLALTPHPQAFGSPLLNPFISTDFSESQLELVAPVFKTEDLLLQFMHLLHRYLYRGIGEERLWPFSSPCILPPEEQIPIARFGNSLAAKEKELYRLGLAHRYGRKMQSLSGVHYNFSFSRNLVERVFPGGDLSSFYLHIVRNYLRYGWIITYLFGSTPVVDKTYFDEAPKELRRIAPDTIGGEFATSLRMSQYGYYSKLQNQISISFNTFEDYLRDLESAVTTPAEQWKAIGDCQINDHIIQIEAEHYSRIRPKPPVNKAIRPLQGLRNEGIVYIELRGIDLNPWNVEGTDLCELKFLHTFLIYCFLMESPRITQQEEKQLTNNQNLVALRGRDPTLELSSCGRTDTLKSFSEQICSGMLPVAEILDKASQSTTYSDSIKKQMEKIDNPELTPSYVLLRDLGKSKSSFREHGLKLANKLREDMLTKPLPKEFEKEMKKASAQSMQDLFKLEAYEDFILKGYEDMELSTQAVIREALKRGIDVEILDRKANFLRLRSEGKTEYVKSATMTSCDSLISYWMMENKEVTKILLEEEGFSTPRGEVFESAKEALEGYHRFEGRKLVIKPNRMNYGIGVYIVGADNLSAYEQAIGSAFQHGQEVICEDFVEGEEYRFLVIDGKVEAVCVRIPANIVGDGVHSIKELIRLKNYDITKHKIPKYFLKDGDDELTVLRKQGLDFTSVPKNGERIFIRNNSNVSTGGDSIDKTDDIHPGYGEIAAKAADVVNARFCGVDIILSEPGKPPNAQNHGIIELNFNPALWIHRYPTYGQKRYVEKAVLDTLGFKE
jgi:glutamate--cysteine ligase